MSSCSSACVFGEAQPLTRFPQEPPDEQELVPTGRMSRSSSLPNRGNSSLPSFRPEAQDYLLPFGHYTFRPHYPLEDIGFDSAISGLIYQVNGDWFVKSVF